MSNCYEVLNIPTDSDVKQIKRAYAALVKLHNPEDDPEGYQELRKAYDQALKNLKRASNIYNNDNSLTYSAPVSDVGNKKIYIENNININFDENENVIEEFSNKLSDIYLDFNKRINIDEWKKLFNDSKAAWNMELMKQIESIVFNFLSTHKLISYEVFELADKYFNWTDNERELYSYYPEEYVKYILYEINSSPKMSYKYLGDINKEKLEEYVILRDKGYKCLKDDNIKQAYKYIDDAYLIYKKDAELLMLFAEYFTLVHNFDCAEDYLNEALEIDKDNSKVNALIEELHDIKSGKKKLLKDVKKSKEREKDKKFTIGVLRTFIVTVIAVNLLCGVVNHFHNNNDYSSKNYNIDNPFDSSDNNINPITQNKDSNDKSPKEIKSSVDIMTQKDNSLVSIKFDEIIPTDFYRLKCDDKSLKEITVLSKDEINKNNQWSNVAERIYIGKLDSAVLIFGEKYINKNLYNDYKNNIVLGHVHMVGKSNYDLPNGLNDRFISKRYKKNIILSFIFIDTDNNSDLN